MLLHSVSYPDLQNLVHVVLFQHNNPPGEVQQLHSAPWFHSVVNRLVPHVCHLIKATLSFTLKLDHQIHHSVRFHLQAALVVWWLLNTFPECL